MIWVLQRIQQAITNEPPVPPHAHLTISGRDGTNHSDAQWLPLNYMYAPCNVSNSLHSALHQEMDTGPELPCPTVGPRN